MLFCLLSNIYKAFEKLLYTKVQIFHDKSNIVYSLQFGFRQHYSTSYALVNLTEETMKAPNDGDFGCRIFLDLQKAFDFEGHSILLGKLCHYGICVFTKNWFKSYKPELIIFKSKRKSLDFNMKITLNGKRLHPTDSETRKVMFIPLLKMSTEPMSCSRV